MTLTKTNTVLLLIVVIVMLAMIYLPPYLAALQANQHAYDKHSWDAVKVVECIQNNGPYMNMAFRAKDGKFYIPCQLTDGRIGLGIFDSEGNNVSAYVPGDGIWQQVRDYILQRAFRYTGPLPF